MNDKYDSDKLDDIMLPGFRFHPTDEELVGMQPLYCMDSFMLSCLTGNGFKNGFRSLYPNAVDNRRKRMVFYCPRDRKYRNSARPNRVTGAEGTKCIGLKKSLVFYTGRAAKELPSLTNPATPKRFTDKTLPVNDSWAICRIFKKTNPWHKEHFLTHGFLQYLNLIMLSTSFSSINIPSYKPDINSTMCKQSQHPTFNGDLSSNFMFSSLDMAGNAKYTADIASMLLNFPPALLGDTDDCPDDSGAQQEYGEDEEAWLRRTTSTLSANDQWGTVRSVDFPFNLPTSNLTWDCLPCPSDISTSFSTNKCYT
ncbi:hypothetical protein MKW92_016671 [Papaver armeniacum]|nr:hypothetical protein MKW92_016671 [Papaver armeniacum]